MPKYATVVIDSVGEMARLYFAKSRKALPGEMDNLRDLNDYTPATERMNIMFRRLKDLRDLGTNVVFIGHEQIEKIYAKGGEIAQRGQPTPEPVAIKGMPDLPGKIAPEELMRACDVILRQRLVNRQPAWVGKPEPLGGSEGSAYWVAGARFHVEGLAPSGYLPTDYDKIVELGKAKPAANFRPPYIWMIYGQSKLRKTYLICRTFPKPMRLFDLDRGRIVLGTDEEITKLGIDIAPQYNTESAQDYDNFVADLTACITQ